MSVLQNFSCLVNLSSDSLTDHVWLVFTPEDSADTVSNGQASATIALLFLLFGLPWNVFVATIIIWKKLYKTPAVLLLLNLVVSNILPCIFILPFIVVSGYAGEFIFGTTDKARCQICQIGIVNITLPLSTIFTTSLLAVDRFLYIKRPLKYYTIVTPTRMVVAVSVIWLLCAVISLPPLFGFGTIFFSYAVSSCVPFVVGSNHLFPNYYFNLFLLAVIIIPLSTLLVMYISILCITRKHLLKRAKYLTVPEPLNEDKGKSSKTVRDLHKKQFRMVQIFGAIFTANIVTWIPMVVLAMTGAVVGIGSIPSYFYNIVYLSYLSAIIVHPMLEVTLIREIREVIVKLCAKRKRGLIKLSLVRSSTKVTESCNARNNSENLHNTSTV